MVLSGSDSRYRVEVIVFHNVGVPAEPDQVDEPRRFHGAFELEDGMAQDVPVRLEKTDGAFANIWSRLDRLADYQPLVRLTFEQTLYDYHPPVRLHDGVAMADDPSLDIALLTDQRTSGFAGTRCKAAYHLPRERLRQWSQLT